MKFGHRKFYRANLSDNTVKMSSMIILKMGTS